MMYHIDEDKEFQISSSSPLTNQHNNAISPSEYGLISSTHNKFLPNLHSSSSYLPLHDLPSLNHTFDTPSPSPTNSIINPIISSSSPCSQEDQHHHQVSLFISKEHNEEQEVRRIKRMISNRESARRSRLRKRKQLENLQAQVLQLLAANHQLAEKLNLVMESNYEILQENARLREEAICLRNELLMTSIKCDPLQDEDINHHNNGASIHQGIRANNNDNNSHNNNNNNNNNNNQTMISTNSPNSISSSMDILR